MFYARYMSDAEHMALIMGCELVNDADHSKRCKTDSVGFCFMPIYTNVMEELHDIENMLAGIVSSDVCVIFRANGAELREGYGVYADHDFDDWDALKSVREYSTTAYDEYVMEPVYTIYRPFD